MTFQILKTFSLAAVLMAAGFAGGIVYEQKMSYDGKMVIENCAGE